MEVCFGSSEFIFLSANTKYPCLQRQRDQEATKLSLLDLTLHLGSRSYYNTCGGFTQDGFKVFICHYSLEDFFVFESYIFEERCEWPLARDQQKAGKRIRHVEKKSEAVCVVTLLPRKIDVFSKKKNCVSLVSYSTKYSIKSTHVLYIVLRQS